MRELEEETGWTVDRVLGLRRVVDWESRDSDGKVVLKREFVVAVTVSGPWEEPRLEESKVSEARWFSLDNVEMLNENRPGTDTYVYDLVLEELHRP